MTELEKAIETLKEHTQHYVPTEDLESLYAVIEVAEKQAEYRTAENDGRMVALPPCNIDDTVYLPIDFKHKIYTGKIEGFEYAKIRHWWVVKIVTDEEITCYERFEDFGKTFFLNKEEAEKALKEMEGSHERILY